MGHTRLTFSLTETRYITVNTLLTWLKTHLHWFVFFILEGASMVMLFRFNHYHNSVWVTQANAVVGQVVAWEAELHSYAQLKDANEILMQQNLSLQLSNERMRQELDSLKHDSTYTERLMTQRMSSFEKIYAHVISNSIKNKDNIITLDKGWADGVENEMGVVSGTGPVGIVYAVSEHYSLVLPILNSKSNISCRLRGTNYFGSLSWRGGKVLEAYLSDIPHHAKCHVGDQVETSGYSHVFPPGIFVGTVSKIRNSRDGQSYELKVKLSTDLSVLRSVCILKNPLKQEIDTLGIMR